MSSSPNAADLLNKYLSGISRGDVDAVVALFAEDGVMSTPAIPEPHPKVINGRANIALMLQWVFANVFKKFSWHEVEIHATDDPNLAFALAKSHVELRDGRIYSNDYAIYSRIKNGEIVENCEFFDTTRAANAFKGLV
jgi:ketosteroid isomerase-like protein